MPEPRYPDARWMVMIAMLAIVAAVSAAAWFGLVIHELIGVFS